MRLKDKVALVTGAGSGIGRAVALRFANEGASVAASDISLASAQETASMVEESGGRTLTLSGDVSVGEDAEAMVEATVSEFGRLDILLNSAGISARNALSEGASPEAIWDKVIDVNLKGTYLVSWFAVPEMEKAGGGSIINLASTMGLVGYPAGFGGGFNPYPPSKGGVVQFTRTLAIDSARKNIRVNCLCPGFVATNFTKALTDDPETNAFLEELHPMGRLGRPEEVANAALYLASDDASYVTGVALTVDGGYTAQ
ncbi:MAG: glucose 1-dehydrogenase [Dehalococcoidia bacterium]|nr:glucose 1-dehydrogenase [Dehalococcoidia bacterium]